MMTSAYMGFIVTRTLPAMYVYGIYRHVPSYWNDSRRFRIIVYTHVTTATGSMLYYTISVDYKTHHNTWYKLCNMMFWWLSVCTRK